MGRKKIQIDLIKDDKVRHVTLKKRRLGLCRKAMQLSKLTGAQIELKVFWEEDLSCIEYFSRNTWDLNSISMNNGSLEEYA